MVLAGLRERFPQLEQLQSMAERWLSSQRVLLAVDETALVLLWQQGESLTLRHVPLPQGLCRAGLPMQREALGELLADLLLDIGIQGGQLEMLLPMQSCQWRLLCWPDGEPDEDQVKALRKLIPELNWPFALADSYLTVKSLQRRRIVKASANLMSYCFLSVFLKRVDSIRLGRMDCCSGSRLA